MKESGSCNLTTCCYSTAREGSLAAPRLVIDLTSSKGENDEVARFVPVMHAIPKLASSIADRIAQRRSSAMPQPKCSGAKSGSPNERLATTKSDKVDSAAEMVPQPIPLAAETDSPAEKNETARAGSCEKFTKLASREAARICVLLKPDLLEDMDACAKFVDGVKGVVCPSSFKKHMTGYRRTALLAIMQKIEILLAKFMLLGQEDTKAVKEVAKTIAAETYSSSEKIERLESELPALNLCPHLCAA